MNRRVFDRIPGPAALLVVVGVLVVGGAIVWLAFGDGGSERGFTATGGAGAPPSPDAPQPLVAGDENGRPASDRPNDEHAEGSISSRRSRGRSAEPRDQRGSADTVGPDRRDEDARPAPDLERLIEDATNGRDHNEPPARPAARIRNLLEDIGDRDQGPSGGPPPELAEALEEIARGG